MSAPLVADIEKGGGGLRLLCKRSEVFVIQ